MRKPYSRDLNRLLDLELERNERVRAVAAAYQELTEGGLGANPRDPFLRLSVMVWLNNRSVCWRELQNHHQFNCGTANGPLSPTTAYGRYHYLRDVARQPFYA